MKTPECKCFSGKKLNVIIHNGVETDMILCKECIEKNCKSGNLIEVK